MDLSTKLPVQGEEAFDEAVGSITTAISTLSKSMPIVINEDTQIEDIWNRIKIFADFMCPDQTKNFFIQVKYGHTTIFRNGQPYQCFLGDYILQLIPDLNTTTHFVLVITELPLNAEDG